MSRSLSLLDVLVVSTDQAAPIHRVVARPAVSTTCCLLASSPSGSATTARSASLRPAAHPGLRRPAEGVLGGLRPPGDATRTHLGTV